MPKTSSQGGPLRSLRRLLWLALIGFAACQPRTSTSIPPDLQAQVKSILDKAWNNEDPFVRAEALRLAATTPSHLWKAQAEKLLADHDPMVSLRAADALLTIGAEESAIETLTKAVQNAPLPQQLTALNIARQRLTWIDFEPVLTAALRTSRSELRREAVGIATALLENKEALAPMEARQLEQRIKIFATDPDIKTVITTLRYLNKNDRLIAENEERRAALLELARNANAADRIRALRILTHVGLPQLQSIAYQIYVDTAKDPEQLDVHNAAILALGASGDVHRIAEIDRLARRDEQPDLQLDALTVLASIDDPDAAMTLGQALDSPKSLLRQTVLEAITLYGNTRVRIPDAVLLDPDPEVRLLALQILWQRDPAHFERTVSQKLGVEQYRAPLIDSLALWAEKDPNPQAPWLQSLAPTLRRHANDYGNRLGQAATIYTLVLHLDGPEPYLDKIDKLPVDAQYVILEALLRQKKGTVQQYQKFLDSPLFAVRLVAAFGIAAKK